VFLLIVAILLLLAIPVLLRIRIGGKPAQTEYAGKGTAPARGRRLPTALSVVAPAAVAVLLILVSSLTTVGTKDVGVVTTYGRPTGRDLANGLHFKAPWQHVTELDGAIQPDQFQGRGCIDVRIGDSTTACGEGTIRWRIAPDQASVLYQDYRSDNVNESIRDSLVKTQFNAALNDVLGQYNPLQSVAQAAASNPGKPATITSTAPNLDKFSAEVKQSMNEHLTSASRGTKSAGHRQIEVVSVTLNFIHLASTTQDKINDFLKEVGATRVAEQHEQTAAAQASANRQLAASVSHDPNVLVSKCLDALEEAIKARYQLPAGFSCWGGSGAVVVPGRQ
jgi:regulator of protease activity HflC (stomatin/prohibitin superfamily)